MYNLILGDVLFPVSPSKIRTKINGRNKTIELINEGEVNILKTAGLTDFEFEVLLPQFQHPFARYPNGFQSASYYLEHLEKLKQSVQPFRFIVNRLLPSGKMLFDTNILVSLEDYEIVEDVEEGFDLLVSINLKQFKPFGNKRLILNNNSNNASSNTKTKTTAKVEKTRDTSTKKPVKTHKVVAGDTIWLIAKKYYGSGNQANLDKLVKLNNIKNPNLIKTGQVLKLE